MAAERIATIPVDGGRIAYRRLGSGRPLIVLNGLAATSTDWDPAFIDQLASANEIVLLDNRGIGASTDDGTQFDISKLANDTARVIEALELERASVLLGWSMGGFIAQTLALNHPARVHKLILLSTDPGGAEAELASLPVWAQLTDMSGTPQEQARRLLFLLFPSDLAESIYSEFGDIVAAPCAQLCPDLIDRQAAAMDAWHRHGVGDRLRELSAPTLVAAGTKDIVIPPSNALALVNAISGAWLARFNGGGHAFMAQYPRPLANLINEFLAVGIVCEKSTLDSRVPWIKSGRQRNRHRFVNGQPLGAACGPRPANSISGNYERPLADPGCRG